MNGKQLGFCGKAIKTDSAIGCPCGFTIDIRSNFGTVARAHSQYVRKAFSDDRWSRAVSDRLDFVKDELGKVKAVDWVKALCDAIEGRDGPTRWRE